MFVDNWRQHEQPPYQAVAPMALPAMTLVTSEEGLLGTHCTVPVPLETHTAGLRRDGACALSKCAAIGSEVSKIAD